MSGHLTSEHHANHYMRSLMWTANCELWICRKIHWKSPIKNSDPQFGHGRRPSTSSCNNNINRHRNKYINKISGRKHMKVFGIIKKNVYDPFFEMLSTPTNLSSESELKHMKGETTILFCPDQQWRHILFQSQYLVVQQLKWVIKMLPLLYLFDSQSEDTETREGCRERMCDGYRTILSSVFYLCCVSCA